MLNKDRFTKAESSDLNTRNIMDKKLKIKQKRRKYLLMTVSLLIAFFMWLYVVNDENPTIKQTFNDVKIEFLNKGAIEKIGFVMTEADHTSVKVTLEGKRSKIRDIKISDIVAYVDVSQYSAGENYVSVNVNVPYSTELVSVNPSQIKLHIEKINSDERDVKVSFMGNYKDGYEPHILDFSEKSVTISGASSATSKVAYLSAIVDASKLTTEAETQKINLVPVDERGRRVSNITLSKKTINVTAQLYKVKTVSLVVPTSGEPEQGYIMSSFEAPSKITIAGPKSEVEAVNSLTANVVNISGLSASKEFDLKVPLTGNIVKSKSQGNLKGKANISKAVNITKDIKYEADKVVLKSVPEGLSASVTGNVTLNITGTEVQLNQVTAADFTLTADCSALSEGKNTVKIDVSLSDKAKSNGIKTDTPYIEVKLSSEENEQE